MKFSWKKAFTKYPLYSSYRSSESGIAVDIKSLDVLKEYFDCIHIKHCLLKPYFETENYPLVEGRELLPSFESDLYEYKHLPGFSMVALERRLNYFQEVFQFDILHNVPDQMEGNGMACPLEKTVTNYNLQNMLSRMPKVCRDDFLHGFASKDVTNLDHYEDLLPFLLHLDRAHVVGADSFGIMNLAGIYASFPSDLDSEIKRFGLRIGKFKVGDNIRYERNRPFVYQFLMELYGFPIVSERRTSAALFARRLHKMHESFFVRVLGQSDRTITTLSSEPEAKFYPNVEKIALVRVEKEQKDILAVLKDGGFFVDAKNRVVILRIKYKQHKFNPDNVRQERALSVESQEVIHPVTGHIITDINIIKDTTNMFLRLNDIVRGEYSGKIVFKRNEIVENTDTDEKRLKFLYAWLSKHQRRIIGYSDEFYAKVVQVLNNYLLQSNNYDVFQNMYELYQEVWAKYSYIQQARKLKTLEDHRFRVYKGKRISYLEMLEKSVETMHELKFEIVNYFDELVESSIAVGDKMLNDSYLINTYVHKKDEELTEYGQEIKRQYGRLVALVDEFKSIRKTRGEGSETIFAKVG